MHTKLQTLIASIKPLDQAAMDKAKARQDSLIKPPGSLGKLEDISVQLAGITGEVKNRCPKKHLLVFAADNGVFEEGVASAPQSVTLQQTINLTLGKTGACVLVKQAGAELSVCDVGVAVDVKAPDVINKKIAYGTKNITKEPAMTRGQALEAILIGAERAQTVDADVFGTGEMGIGNTTTSAAVLSTLLSVSPERVTGRGAGITDEAYENKKRVVERAIEINKPNKDDVIDVISKVGGFDIAAMCGAFLGAASKRKPIVIDGFISAVAALCAYRLAPEAKNYMIPSHASFEIGYALALEALGLSPMLAMNMRLGEGSGCPLTFQLIDAACAVMNDMATFSEGGIDDEYLENIKQGDNFTVKITHE